MQEPTHILAGVIIQRSLERIKPRPLALALTAVTAFLSHGLLDRLANMTYHPQADFKSPFWIGYHLCVLTATIWFLYLWWRPYKWGIFFAMLPDVDWIFIHSQEIFHFRIPFYRQPHLHHWLGLIFDRSWPFSHLRVPNNRRHPWACLIEVALVLAMLALIRFLNRRKSLQPPPVLVAN